MSDGSTPAGLTGDHAVVTFPAEVTSATAGPVGARLLAACDRGAAVVIADMTETTSCDQAAADVLTRAYQRALLHNAELRVVASAPEVRRLLAADGLDRLVAVYPALEAAHSVPNWTSGGGSVRAAPAWAGAGAPALPPTGVREPGQDNAPATARLTAVLLRQLIDALSDGVALTDEDGAIVLANRQLTAMFGYEPGELAGHVVEALIPADLREAHRDYRAAYAREPTTRPMGDRARLIGLRKDGGTLPLTITLSPVPTADGMLVLVVVRAPAQARRQEDLAELARAAAERADQAESLLDRVVRSLFHVGLSLQAAVDQPADLARTRIADALHRLDETIHEIRAHVFGTWDHGGPPAG